MLTIDLILSFSKKAIAFKVTLKHKLWVRGNPAGYPSEFV